MELKESMYAIRIASAHDALKRSRLAFFVATVVSLAVLFATWNVYLSWYRGHAMEDQWSKTSEVTAEAQKTLVQEWVKSGTISVALLGIRVGVSDAAPLASFSLLITVIWFFYTVRRENHTIGTLLIDSQNENADLQSMVYHGVVSQLVFLDVSGGDDPIRHLTQVPEESHALPLIRGALRLLAFLPPITIFFVVTMDILSIVYLDAPFHDPPHARLLDTGFKPHEWFWLAVFEVVAITIGVAAAFLVHRTLAYEKGTAQILTEYCKKMNQKLPTPTPITAPDGSAIT